MPLFFRDENIKRENGTHKAAMGRCKNLKLMSNRLLNMVKCSFGPLGGLESGRNFFSTDFSVKNRIR